MSKKINPNTKTSEEIDNELQKNGTEKNPEHEGERIYIKYDSCEYKILLSNTQKEEQEINKEGELTKEEEELIEVLNEEFRETKDEVVSKLNPETEVLTEPEPDEARKANENKILNNWKNKNQPL
jgi:hypothetical protein